MKTKSKVLILTICATLIIGAGVFASLAFLTDTTDTVTNTFTVGNVNIELDETKTDFKMVPGVDIEKDPIVTVVAGSEDCWLFVKIEESDNLDDFIDYDIADGWTQLKDGDENGVEGVFYRSVSSSTLNQEFSVLEGDKVTVLDTVTKQMMDALEDDGATLPTLTFKAYAVQKASFDTAFEAWDEVE